MSMVSRVLRSTIKESLFFAGHTIRNLTSRTTSTGIRTLSALRNTSTSLEMMLNSYNFSSFGKRDEVRFLALPESHALVSQAISSTKYRNSLGELDCRKFSSGETYIRILDSKEQTGTVRGKTVVIFQDFSQGNINDRIIEALLAVDAAVRADAKKVVLAAPSLPYMDDAKESVNYSLDFFKLMIEIFFSKNYINKTDIEFQIGKVNINCGSNVLHYQEQNLLTTARFLQANADHIGNKPNTDKPKDIAFMVGSTYRKGAKAIIERLKAAYSLTGEMIDTQFIAMHNNGQITAIRDDENNLAGKTVFVFQSCDTGKINDNLIEALLMIYTARRKGAKEIVLVMPQLPYNRQDRKAKNREAISAKVVFNMLTTAGATRIVTMDLHNSATEGYTDKPVAHATAMALIAEVIMRLNESDRGNLVSGAPDVGRAKVARRLGEKAIGKGYKVVIFDKDRTQGMNESSIHAIIGDVAGKDVILTDDMIDTGGSIIHAVKALKLAGANNIYIATVHPVFSESKIALFDKNGKEIIDAGAEYNQITEFLRGKNLTPSKYIRVSPDGKTIFVNALVRLQASSDISKIYFTDTINVPIENMIDGAKVEILQTSKIFAAICAALTTTGSSIRNLLYEAFIGSQS